ncbi:MAG TPA: phosphatase PAP2 family protein [Puia sp.]|nr:phosphatase PAP2 family protein [Puia sp.]
MKRLATVAVCLTWGCRIAMAQDLKLDNRLAAGDTIKEVSITSGWGSAPDTLPHRIDWQKAASYKQPFPFQSLFLPAAMIAYGATAVHNGALQKVNGEVKDQIWEDNPHQPFHLDNYLMFAPTLSVYALNAAGVHGAHNFKDRTIILLMANVLANGTVFSVKSWSHERRPDGSDYASFPSGHTAEAFVGAEFMRLEYKDVSPWYGIAGYAMATATGMLRMYNDKHWLSDVVAGAGVGIASTRIAYWLYPKMQHLFGKGKNPDVVNVVMPTYNNGSFGLSYVKTF